MLRGADKLGSTSVFYSEWKRVRSGPCSASGATAVERGWRRALGSAGARAVQPRKRVASVSHSGSSNSGLRRRSRMGGADAWRPNAQSVQERL